MSHELALTGAAIRIAGLREAAEKALAESDLAVGCSVRCVGIGACTIVDHVERDFRGRKRVFAVLSFPHRDLSAQLPIEEETIASRLAPLASVTDLYSLLETIGGNGRALQRTWDEREEEGQQRLQMGGPAEWAALLRDYACAARSGMLVAGSDGDLVREAIDLLAAELSCAAGLSFEEARSHVEERYLEAARSDC